MSAPAVTAYREGARFVVTPYVAPPLWQRLAALLPFVGPQWDWYRHRKGGQWSRMFRRVSVSDAWTLCGWRPVPECPAKDITGSAYRRSDCTDTVCKCEVHS
jgi:hypothetical protein